MGSSDGVGSEREEVVVRSRNRGEEEEDEACDEGWRQRLQQRLRDLARAEEEKMGGEEANGEDRQRRPSWVGEDGHSGGFRQLGQGDEASVTGRKKEQRGGQGKGRRSSGSRRRRGNGGGEAATGGRRRKRRKGEGGGRRNKEREGESMLGSEKVVGDETGARKWIIERWRMEEKIRRDSGGAQQRNGIQRRGGIRKRGGGGEVKKQRGRGGR